MSDAIHLQRGGMPTLDLRPPMATRLAWKWLTLAGLALLITCAAGALYVYARLTRGVPADAARRTNLPGVIYWHGPRDSHSIALTFDDGPSPYTPALLDVLAEHHVKATFFFVGSRVALYPDLARRVVAAGHAIGNHSFTHRNLNLETEHQVAAELTRTNDTIARVTGLRPALFRPPFGYEDRYTLRVARRLHLLTIDWSISSKDWLRPGAPQIVANVLSHLHDGAIVLLHDGGGDRSQTIEAVTHLIPALTRRGYSLVTIPDLLGVPATLP